MAVEPLLQKREETAIQEAAIRKAAYLPKVSKITTKFLTCSTSAELLLSF